MAWALEAMPWDVVMRRIGTALAGAAVALLVGGCLPSLALRTGRPIVADNVTAIKPGATTKNDLFERFGAPTAIVVRDEIAAVATPESWTAPFRNESTYGFDAAAFYALFPAAPDSAEYRRIYYYHHVESRKMTYVMILFIYERGRTTWDRLWVLVNEKTGIVEDYAFRKSGADTVFGVPRGAPPR